MARERLIPIEHKELELRSEVLESTLGAWRRGGWTPVDDVDSADEEPDLFSSEDNEIDAQPGADEE